MKTCKTCKISKEETDFDKQYIKGYPNLRRRECKKCRNEYKKTFRNGQSWRDRRLKYLYGINQEDYNKMFKEQDGKCKICFGPPSDKYGKNLAVDHDHKTGKVRGLLCAKCNKGLGQFNDNPELFQRAISYIKG